MENYEALKMRIGYTIIRDQSEKQSKSMVMNVDDRKELENHYDDYTDDNEQNTGKITEEETVN